MVAVGKSWIRLTYGRDCLYVKLLFMQGVVYIYKSSERDKNAVEIIFDHREVAWCC